ncbi:MAG: hypothetical protein CMJ40_04055 [Phycisphaerae bacterium]|nr:hypothetical protein [Phycisphaerae bacterium]
MVDDLADTIPPDPNDPDVQETITRGESVGHDVVPADTLIGSRIGQYTIRRIIGSGGMGTVYEALQKSPRRTVAIKMLKDGFQSPKAIQRFEFESQLLARLQHPGIAKVYESGMHEGASGNVPFFVMEYIANAKTLTEYAQERKLSTRERLELFRKVCAAVHHGHQKGIVHRDLKPGNILVDVSGEPRIIDFGVARSTDSDLLVTTLQTNVGTLVGTLQYMSPEQVEGDSNAIDTRSDVYAMGVIFFELLSGQLPYDLRNAAIHEVARVVMEEDPTRISTIDRRLRGDVETIALKALAKDRNRRYQSALDLEHDIERYLSGDPIDARPASMVYRLGKFTRKYRAASISALIVLCAIIAGGIISLLGWQEAERQKALVIAERNEVEARNDILDESIAGMLSDVMNQIRYLGNSANAQRALIDMARDNLDKLVTEDRDTPMRRAQMLSAWMRIAKSHINMSGVGYGSAEEAQSALKNASELLEDIDDSAIEDEKIRRAIESMRLDHPKQMAELARMQASSLEPGQPRTEFLEAALAEYRKRRDAAAAYGAAGGDEIKSVDVQYSSCMGMGNTLVELAREDEAIVQYEQAREHARRLEAIDQKNRTRRLRDRAICLYALASVQPDTLSTKARSQLDEAIELTRAIIALSPDNVRRLRDLAKMLALRGEIRLVRLSDIDGGIGDYEESIDHFTTRAIESPMEPVSQSDFQDTVQSMMTHMASVARDEDGRRIKDLAVTQLQCIAEAEAKGGRTQWIEILASLQAP